MKLWRLAGYARTERAGLALLIAFMAAGTLLTLLTPWPMKLVIDNVLAGEPLPASLNWIQALPGAGGDAGLLAWLSVSTVLLIVLQQSMSVAQSYVSNGVSARMVYRLAADLFDHLQRLSLRVHSQQSAGDLVRRVTADSACARNLVMGVFLPSAISALNIVTMFAVMWKLDRSLSVLALLAAIPLPPLMKALTPQMTECEYRKSELQGRLMAHLEQTLSALPIVQAFGREAHGDRTFRDLTDRIHAASLRSLSAQMKFKVAVSAPTAVGAAAMMALGGLHVLQGSLSVGSLMVFLAYLNSLYGPISSLAYLSTGYAAAAASWRRVLEILETDPGVQDAPGAIPLPARPRSEIGNVQFENVTFGYEPGRPVLQDITLEARPGEVIAIVGPTGAGKSTLVSLIPRFFDPWKGRVMVNGMDVRHVQVASLRAQVSVVLQDPFLLPLSVAENIAYGRPEASRDQVIAAAAAANADDFIRRLPDGYDSVIGEKGGTLSGGEKQRIAIARALLKNAPILILDEPTSALDVNTEAEVLEALNRLMHGRTTFIIAHRLSTIRNAGRIIVIDGGRIIEAGGHRELLESKKTYYRFHSLQNGQAAETGA